MARKPYKKREPKHSGIPKAKDSAERRKLYTVRTPDSVGESHQCGGGRRIIKKRIEGV